MKYISLYTNNPTEGMTDGTVISEGGAQTSPLSVTLNASNNEEKTLKCAVRCAEGYETVGDTTISFTGDTAEKWKVSLAEDSDFSPTITITDVIGAVNKVFYVKVSTDDTEEPSNDTSVSITCSSTVKATS